MELELAVLDSRGNLDNGGAAELMASGPAGPMNEKELLVTILLILLTLIIFGLSNTGKAVFDALDSLGAGRATVTDAAGGRVEFSFENR